MHRVLGLISSLNRVSLVARPYYLENSNGGKSQCMFHIDTVFSQTSSVFGQFNIMYVEIMGVES